MVCEKVSYYITKTCLICFRLIASNINTSHIYKVGFKRVHALAHFDDDVVCISLVKERFIGYFQNDPRVIIYDGFIDIRVFTIFLSYTFFQHHVGWKIKYWKFMHSFGYNWAQVSCSVLQSDHYNILTTRIMVGKCGMFMFRSDENYQ